MIIKNIILTLKTIINPYYLVMAKQLADMDIQDIEDRFANYPLPEKEILILATAMAQNNKEILKAQLLENYLDSAIQMDQTKER